MCGVAADETDLPLTGDAGRKLVQHRLHGRAVFRLHEVRQRAPDDRITSPAEERGDPPIHEGGQEIGAGDPDSFVTGDDRLRRRVQRRLGFRRRGISRGVMDKLGHGQSDLRAKERKRSAMNE